MKKLVVLSDTHGNIKGVESLQPLFAENDLVVHLGDGAGDMREIFRLYPEKVYLCGGNCDFFTHYPEEGELDVEGVKIFYCHGHKYGVKSGLQKLAQEARRRGCQVALYGHTHCARCEKIERVLCINPGSMRHNVGHGGSYAYIVVHKGEITSTIVGESIR